MACCQAGEWLVMMLMEGLPSDVLEMLLGAARTLQGVQSHLWPQPQFFREGA